MSMEDTVQTKGFKGYGDSTPHPDIEEVVISHEQIQDIVRAMGARISADYAGKTPLLVCILKGASLFMSDLIRAIDLNIDIDFMVVSSYGNATQTSGTVNIIKDVSTNIAGRDIILVEDIVDSGLTLACLQEELKKRNPASIEIASFLVKELDGPRAASVTPRYAGATIDDRFVVGYGLDYAEKYRNLPYVGVLKESVYA